MGAISPRNQIRPLGWANLWGCPLDLCRKMPLQCPVPFREVGATLKGLLSPALSSRGGEGNFSDTLRNASRFGFVRLFLGAAFLAISQNHFPGRFQPG